jgi:thioesterase domain-containing protein
MVFLSVSNLSLPELNQRLLRDFPMMKAMRAEVSKIDFSQCTVQAPLSANINHKGTVFGGSLYSVAALSCYGLFLFGLRQHGVPTDNIVIAHGEMDYIKPVTKDFDVVASWLDPNFAPEFFSILLKKGKARAPLVANVYVDSVACAQFNAEFVARHSISQP